jgi:F0F1-type ATP synthase beta subunit
MTDALDQYLTQPFFVAEHVTGQAGEHVATDKLQQRVTELLAATTRSSP